MKLVVVLCILITIELSAALMPALCNGEPKQACVKYGGDCWPRESWCPTGPMLRGRRFCQNPKLCSCCADCSYGERWPCEALNGSCISLDAVCDGIEVIDKRFCKWPGSCKCCIQVPPCPSDVPTTVREVPTTTQDFFGWCAGLSPAGFTTTAGTIASQPCSTYGASYPDPYYPGGFAGAQCCQDNGVYPTCDQPDCVVPGYPDCWAQCFPEGSIVNGWVSVGKQDCGNNGCTCYAYTGFGCPLGSSTITSEAPTIPADVLPTEQAVVGSTVWYTCGVSDCGEPSCCEPGDTCPPGTNLIPDCTCPDGNICCTN